MSNKPLYRGLSRAVSLILFAAILSGAVSTRADTGPQPPCGSAAFPSWPDLENPPAIRVWDRANTGHDWVPPACTGWTDPGFTTLVATAARFRQPSGVEGLLRRIGAISGLAGMRYWSTTHERWQTLIISAHALSDATGDRIREDFSPGEMAEGKVLFFRQEDSVFGKAVYRLRIRSASPDLLVFDTENTGAVSYLRMTLFRPGELQSITFLERESRDVWRFYNLSRTGRNVSRLTEGREASSVNRAVAFYRHLAGIPTDKEPPAAR